MEQKQKMLQQHASYIWVWSRENLSQGVFQLHMLTPSCTKHQFRTNSWQYNSRPPFNQSVFSNLFFSLFKENIDIFWVLNGIFWVSKTCLNFNGQEINDENCLNKTILLRQQNLSLNWWKKIYSQLFTPKFCLFWPMVVQTPMSLIRTCFGQSIHHWKH